MYVRVKKILSRSLESMLPCVVKKKRRKVTTRTQYDQTDLNKDSKPRPHFSRMIEKVLPTNLFYLNELLICPTYIN